MSTRKGQAAAVTLLRHEQLRSASAPTGCGARLKKRADRGVRPYNRCGGFSPPVAFGDSPLYEEGAFGRKIVICLFFYWRESCIILLTLTTGGISHG